MGEFGEARWLCGRFFNSIFTAFSDIWRCFWAKRGSMNAEELLEVLKQRCKAVARWVANLYLDSLSAYGIDSRLKF